MARAGRGWPLSTQYHQQPTIQTVNRMQGSLTFRLHVANTSSTVRRVELQGESLSTPRYIGTANRGGGMRIICLNNDHVIARSIRRLNEATGTFEPATGLGIVKGFLSTTDSGQAISETVSVDLVERVGQPGVYYGVIEGNALSTSLLALVGQPVYERVVIATDYSDSVGYTVQGVKVIQ